MSVTEPFTLRDARGQDRTDAVAVTLAAYEQYAAYMPTWAWKRYREDIVETLEKPGDGEHIVAEQNGALVGSVLLLTPKSDEPEVRLLAVAPPARGQGIGAALMQACIQRARQAGYPSLALHTADVMAIAMHMYEQMGFVRALELDFSPLQGALIKGYRLALAP
ncbi:MAG: GNAT family N-acetyltransferase [Chloroflexi bacterium]|nr:GNAT family N-acetyltransferase [Chloroflexota bacterium]